MRKRYNTPHRSRVVKTRMTEEEYAEFAERLSAYNMSQAEFIRQAITGAAIRPIITVSPVNDELLAAVGKLTAEYGRIGGNLNQIARTLNEWHSPYPQLAGEVRAAVSDLAALKFEVLQKVGDAEVYVAYRKAGYSKKFREEHEEEILLHQAAKNAFDEMGVKKLPKVKELQTEYAKLLEEKKKTYAEYRRSREEMRELLTAKANVDRVLKMEVEQDVEKEKDHGQR